MTKKMDKSAAIKAAKKTNLVDVPCNEFKPDDWPETEDFDLFVRSLPGPERLKMERAATKGKYKKNPDALRHLILLHCVFNDADCKERSFEGFTQEEITNMNPVPRERLFDVALRISGVTNKEIDELVGN